MSLIPYPCGFGAKIIDCADAPKSLIDWGLEDKISQKNAKWQDIIPCDNIKTACDNLYQQIATAITNGQMPVTIGGDHSMAIGTWSAMADKLDIAQNLGLIWIDAHLDAHTHKTSPSGAIHGMPASCLLGADNQNLLVKQGQKINPNHLIYIGIRSFEEGEYNFLKQQNVKIYTIHDVIKLGLDNIINESVEFLIKNTSNFGLTIDLDAFDPDRAPAVGTPENNGLLRQEVFNFLKNIGNHPQFAALEIAEYNPHLDEDNITKLLIADLLTAIFNK